MGKTKHAALAELAYAAVSSTASLWVRLPRAVQISHNFVVRGHEKNLDTLERQCKNAAMEQCTTCGKFYSKKGIGTHIWRSHGDGKNFKSTKVGEKIAWNKGLTKLTSVKVAEISKKVSTTLKKKYVEGALKPNSPSIENRKKTSERQSSNNSGGRCKWYDVSGIKVQGTWERDLALKMNDLEIKWNRPTSGLFPYTKENKQHNYTPDFFLPDYNIFLEIKGFWWGNDKHKMILVEEANPGLSAKIKIVEKQLFALLKASTDINQFLKAINITPL